MQINDFLKVLKNVKQTGDAHTARCPGHDDKINSLSIGQGDDGCILLHCHAGCSTEHILSKMELKLSDLFLDSQTDTKRIESVYSYVDENGKTLYEVVRYHPKDFRQRVPDGNGGYSYKLGNVRRVLYNLPNVISAVRTNQTIFIVEGEKDVDALRKLGIVATTNSGGGGKWHNLSDDSVLHGRNVAIIPDNDEAGHNHAHDVALALHGKAKATKIVELPNLPPKGDVSDWLTQFDSKDHHGAYEAIHKLACETPDFVPDGLMLGETDKPQPLQIGPILTCFADVQPRDVEWLWPKRIAVGEILML